MKNNNKVFIFQYNIQNNNVKILILLFIDLKIKKYNIIVV